MTDSLYGLMTTVVDERHLRDAEGGSRRRNNPPAATLTPVDPPSAMGDSAYFAGRGSVPAVLSPGSQSNPFGMSVVSQVLKQDWIDSRSSQTGQRSGFGTLGGSTLTVQPVELSQGNATPFAPNG